MTGYHIAVDDVLHWAETYDGEPFHALLCDPPYGLTSESRQSICNRVVKALSKISLPELDKGHVQFLQQADLTGIPADGTPLSRRKLRAIIESGICVPESTIDLDGDIELRQPEIETSSESSHLVSNVVLANEVNTEDGQFLGNFILDLRDALDLARRDVLSSDLAEFTSGCFSVPIVPVFMQKGGSAFATFLQRNEPDLAQFIGLCDDSGGQSETLPSVVASTGTVNTLMLRFDMRRRALELFATHRATKADRLATLGCPKLIRAGTTTGSLSPMFEPVQVRLISPTANGTGSGYLHLWLLADFWNSLSGIIPQGGFMGKQWDAALPDIEMWLQLKRHLYPGAFVMAFSSSRTYDQLARDLREAGFRLHPSIFGYCFGSGFPKATRIDTQIDKAAGAEREVVGNNGTMPDIRSDNYSNSQGKERLTNNLTAPSTPLAQAWEGHRYGLQALKPSLEPIIVAQVPYDGKPVDSITATGAGTINIDGGRIGTDTSRGDRYNDKPPLGGKSNGIYQDNPRENIWQVKPGRWPANFYVSHTPECERVGVTRVKNRGTSPGGVGVQGDGANKGMFSMGSKVQSTYADADGMETVASWRCPPHCPVRRLSEQAGQRKSGGRKAGESWITTGDITGFGGDYAEQMKRKGATVRRDYVADTGTAARFYHNADWSYEVAERLATCDPVKYQAKASRKERDAGLGMAFPLGEAPASARSKPAPGRKNALGEPRRNIHPCCKPLKLTEWLATLLLPPDVYAPRRLLVPFSGSGSEMIGAKLAGWEIVVGVEMSQDYADIAEARLEYWCNKPQQLGLEFS